MKNQKQEYFKKDDLIKLFQAEADKLWAKCADWRSMGSDETADQIAHGAKTLDHWVGEFKNMKGKLF